jgi:hypothetical protein
MRQPVEESFILCVLIIRDKEINSKLRYWRGLKWMIWCCMCVLRIYTVNINSSVTEGNSIRMHVLYVVKIDMR